MKSINRYYIFFPAIIILFFSFSKDGFASKTLVNIEVTVHDSNVHYLKIPEFSIWVKESTGWSHSDLLKLNRYGQAQKRFYHNSIVDFTLKYYGYTIVDTTIDTKTFGIINLHFDLYKRPVEFSKAIAEQDIKNNDPHLIIFDEEIYRANEQSHFTEPLGFTYLLRSNPRQDDGHNLKDEFANDQYMSYNTTILNYLQKQVPDFYTILAHQLDTFVNLEADQRTIHNPISCSILTLTKEDSLPRKVQKSLASIVQRKDDQYYPGSFLSTTYKISIDSFKSSLQTNPDVFSLLDLMACTVNHYDTLIPYLICQLTNNKFVGTQNIESNSRVIKHSNGYSETVYLPPGYFTKNCFLGTVAGRAEFILFQITGQSFGSINASSGSADLKKIQGRWIYWLYMIDLNNNRNPSD